MMIWIFEIRPTKRTIIIHFILHDNNFVSCCFIYILFFVSIQANNHLKIFSCWVTFYHDFLWLHFHGQSFCGAWCKKILKCEWSRKESSERIALCHRSCSKALFSFKTRDTNFKFRWNMTLNNRGVIFSRIIRYTIFQILKLCLHSSFSKIVNLASE